MKYFLSDDSRYSEVYCLFDDDTASNSALGVDSAEEKDSSSTTAYDGSALQFDSDDEKDDPRHNPYGRRWMEEWMDLTPAWIQSFFTPDTGGPRSGILNDFYMEYMQAINLYGRIIVEEMDVPYAEKTIKPVSIGGIAGGEKYITHGLLFKFAVDQKLSSGKYMYGGDAPAHNLARKAAGREYIGAYAIMLAFVNELTTTPITLFDYRGYRLTCVPLLPIGSDSLRYGSADGGRTIECNAEAGESVEIVAERLNLQKHEVFGKNLSLCGDIEIHKGTDGRLYVLDTARVFPPEDPRAGERPTKPRSIFYEHLRPELTLANPIPLNSDAFSGWNARCPSRVAQEKHVREATARLRSVCVPQAAASLEAMFSLHSELLSLRWISKIVHLHGCNVRHVGLVRLCSETERVQKILATSLAARTLKNRMFEAWRGSRGSQARILRTTAAVLNAVRAEEQQWRQEMAATYEGLPGDAPVDRHVLLDMLLELTGVKLNPRARRSGRVFLVNDIVEIEPRVQPPFSMFVVQATELMESSAGDAELFDEVLPDICRLLERAVDDAVCCYTTHSFAGYAKHLLAKRMWDAGKTDEALLEALEANLLLTFSVNLPALSESEKSYRGRSHNYALLAEIFRHKGMDASKYEQLAASFAEYYLAATGDEVGEENQLDPASFVAFMPPKECAFSGMMYWGQQEQFCFQLTNNGDVRIKERMVSPGVLLQFALKQFKYTKAEGGVHVFDFIGIQVEPDASARDPDELLSNLAPRLELPDHYTFHTLSEVRAKQLKEALQGFSQ